MASSDQFAGQTRRPLLLVFIGLLLVPPISNLSTAQTTTSGGLAGVVTDPSNAVVPNAAVEIKDETKGTHQSTKTDREGVYRFFFLAPERYTLTVSLAGFQTENRAVNVLLGPPVSVNVTLQVAMATTSLSVTAEAPLIQAENGDVSATMNQKQISEVPNPGNDLTYIAQTAPGVVMNTDQQNAVNFSILGMPGTSYFYTIDGASDNEVAGRTQLVGPLNLLLGQNQIQEATIVSTGYSGQFGGAAGGNINYITKSGSNEFHGNAQYYWNGRVLNANDWFNKRFDSPRPFDIANQWAGSIGGPFKKNKLFFFFDTEGLRLFIPQTLFGLLPSPQFEVATIANIDLRFGSTSASDAFYKRIFNLYNGASVKSSATPGGFTDPFGCTGFSDQRTGLGVNVPCALHFYTTQGRPSQDTLTSGRVDWNVSGNDRAFLRAQYDGGHWAGYTDPISSLFDADGNLRWWQTQMVETHAFGPSAANQFLLTGSYWDWIYQTKNPSEALAAFPTFLTFVPGTFANLGGADNNFVFGFGGSTTRYQLSDDFVKTRARQKFGFGATFERIYWSFLGYTINNIGTLASQTLDAFYQGGVDPASPNVDFTELTQSFAAAKSQRIAFYNFGLYSQDEWQAQHNLTLTIALRLEHKSNPVCQSRCFARVVGPFESITHDPNQPYSQVILINQRQALMGLDNLLWLPRFSVAWQPLGLSHNTVIRGGVGIFYDPLQGYVTQRPSANPPIVNSYTIGGDNLTPDEKTNLFKDAATSNAEFVDGFAAGKTLAQIQATDPSFFPPGIVVFQKQMHFPQYQRWSIEWQQAFGTQTSFSMGYFGHHGIHELVENPSANAFGFGSLPARLCTSPPVQPCADPRFSEVTEMTSAAVSNYQGMVISFQHRFSRWSQGFVQANYTYGHAFDEVSNGGDASFTYGSSLNPQNPNDLRGAYGQAEYDVRHSFNASYVLELPVKAVLSGRGSDSLVKGWQVSGTVFARTGFPYTVFDYAESTQLSKNNYFSLLYAVPTGPIGSGSSCGEGAAVPYATHPCQPPQVLRNGNPNPNARFIQTGCETGFNIGNLPGPSGPCGGVTASFLQGRNRFRGPSYFNTDFTIMKNTKIPRWESATLGIGFQFFNFFNHPNFGFADNYSSSQTFGQLFYLEQPPTSILGSGLGGDVAPRMIQLKAQLQF